MLNLNCVICAELFVGADDVHATSCGHMFHFVCLKQWLERSKSCPQCRNKCTDRNIFRIYFNLANLDVSTIDVGSLQEQLDSANLQVKLKEQEINKAEQTIKNLKEAQSNCTKTISVMDKRIQKNDAVILNYQEQLKMMKTHVKAGEDVRKELENLKRQLNAMEAVQSVMAATNAEVEKLLKNERDPVRLCTWVATLKRELRACETKKTDLRRTLKVLQDNLRSEMAKKKSCEERISQLESENYQLQEKLKLHESSSPAKVPSNIFDLVPEKPVEKRYTISPTIKENIKRIEESNSPYFNIKSSSIGLMPLFKRNQDIQIDRAENTTTKLATLKISPKKIDKLNVTSLPNSANTSGLVRKTQSDMSERYSIMKKPRLNLPNPMGKTRDNQQKAGNIILNALSKTIDLLEVEDSRLPSAVPKSIGSSLDNRLKSGGLRNFKMSK